MTAEWRTTGVPWGAASSTRSATWSRRSPLPDHGRVPAGDVDGGAQPLAALVLLRPDQVLQPRHRVGVRDVERVEVDTAPPGDVRVGGGDGQVAGGPGAQQRTAAPPQPADGRPLVVVAVGEQAETGAGPDLDQRQRPLDEPEDRDEGRETADLVGLGRPLHDGGAHRRLLLEQHGTQGVVRRRGGGTVPPGGGEDQVGLALDGGSVPARPAPPVPRPRAPSPRSTASHRPRRSRSRGTRHHVVRAPPHARPPGPPCRSGRRR